MSNDATIKYMLKHLEEKYGSTDNTEGIEAAIKSLGPYSWTLHTCDAGYGCQIYEAPERGGRLLGEWFDDTIEGAINGAVKGSLNYFDNRKRP